MSKILVHNNWDPLEEIWLGDVWPTHFYDDLEPGVRDAFYQITELTKEDLNNIQKKLEEFNVIVKRPYVDGDKSLYLDPNNHNKLCKPPITPRDNNAVIGDKLFFWDSTLSQCYDPLLKNYPQEQITRRYHVSGADLVKLGKDIIIDGYNNFKNEYDAEAVYTEFHQRQATFSLLSGLMAGYRIHYGTNGGHSDGCFMPVKEGLLLATSYWNDYDLMFPGWETIALNNPTYHKYAAWNGHNSQRWMVPGPWKFPHFNEYIEQYCHEWIGNFKETYFEVNVVMIDEKNMLCMGEHPILFEKLEKHGITCHVVPFRTRTFWDGGLHCITLDVRRKAVMKNYFPERTGCGVVSALTTHFKNDFDAFLSGYETWKKSKGFK